MTLAVSFFLSMFPELLRGVDGEAA
jgi:hypothetical protein